MSPCSTPQGKKSRRCRLLHLGSHQPSPERIHWNLLAVSLQCRAHSRSVPTGWAGTKPSQQSEGKDSLHPVPKVKCYGPRCQRKAGGASPLVPRSPGSMHSAEPSQQRVRWGPWRSQCPEKSSLKMLCIPHAAAQTVPFPRCSAMSAQRAMGETQRLSNQGLFSCPVPP